jgi:hypothetical protein
MHHAPALAQLTDDQPGRPVVTGGEQPRLLHATECSRGLVRVEMPGLPVPLRDRLRQRDQQSRGLRDRPGQRREIPAPCRSSRVTSEFMLRPAANRPAGRIAVNPFVNRPFPIAFGGPGAITVAGPRQPRSLLQRRWQFPRTVIVTCQSSCSPDRCVPSTVNGSPQSGQQYPPPGKSQITSTPRQVRVIPPPRPRPRAPGPRQNPCRRSHEPQQTPPSPANHAPRSACRSRWPREPPRPPSQYFRILTGQLLSTSAYFVMVR